MKKSDYILTQKINTMEITMLNVTPLGIALSRIDRETHFGLYNHLCDLWVQLLKIYPDELWKVDQVLYEFIKRFYPEYTN